jgi:hypothetical protein
MAVIVIQHPITDFAAWKQAFDSDPLGRARGGVIRHTVLRAADDPNQVAIHLEFASREQAEKFLPPLREMWRRVGERIGFGGVEGVQARILDVVESVDYPRT